MKNIALIGSTGSIGKNALEIIRYRPDRFRVEALAVRTSAELLLEQAKEFRPRLVCVFDPAHARPIESELRRLKIKLVTGEEGLIEASTLPGVHQVLFALVGASGLPPIFRAVQAGKNVAVANKEPLVMAGRLLMREAAKKGVEFLPIDSEHSGLWQCLGGKETRSVKKLILTSSGGPFRDRKGPLSNVTVQEALRHPKWRMGPKITIDSSTLMNKGLEVIEAANLFSLPVEQVEVLIHPEAIVHALVEFVDGSHLAQLAVTDMRIPIQYALTYPERLNHFSPSLDLARIGRLHFKKPDLRRFPCLELGYEAGRTGGTLPAVLNGADEIAVAAFLEKKISFLGIPRILERVMSRHRVTKDPSLADILAADRWSREEAAKLK